MIPGEYTQVGMKWYVVPHLLELSGLVLVSEMLNKRLDGVGCTRANRGSYTQEVMSL